MLASRVIANITERQESSSILTSQPRTCMMNCEMTWHRSRLTSIAARTAPSGYAKHVLRGRSSRCRGEPWRSRSEPPIWGLPRWRSNQFGGVPIASGSERRHLPAMTWSCTSGTLTQWASSPISCRFSGVARWTDVTRIHPREGFNGKGGVSPGPAVFARQLRRKPQIRRALLPKGGSHA